MGIQSKAEFGDENGHETDNLTLWNPRTVVISRDRLRKEPGSSAEVPVQ